MGCWYFISQFVWASLWWKLLFSESFQNFETWIWVCSSGYLFFSFSFFLVTLGYVHWAVGIFWRWSCAALMLDITVCVSEVFVDNRICKPIKSSNYLQSNFVCTNPLNWVKSFCTEVNLADCDGILYLRHSLPETCIDFTVYVSHVNIMECTTIRGCGSRHSLILG